jgi:hypothetical protein
MPTIVAVHGIGWQYAGAHILHRLWLDPLRDGLALAGATLPNDHDLVCAFYGNLFRFRPKGAKALGDSLYDASDVTDEWEQDLLEQWWWEAARVEPQVVSPDATTKARTPGVIQHALNALSNSPFFAGIADHLLIGDLKQVHSYLHDSVIRDDVQQRVARCITPETRVLIGHSLGSIVAYEALCAHPDWPVHTLVTLGSPLGIRNLIFDRLRPPPRNGAGAWPGGAKHWVNIADGGDVVALVKGLRVLFDGTVDDRLIYNGARAHDATPYLTAEETGNAIAAGLAG